jgi:chromosome segregation ATPase
MSDDKKSFNLVAATKILNDYKVPFENVDISDVYYAATQFEAAYDTLNIENEKNKKALRDIADGYPSEWAYTILKKNYDALAKQCEELKENLEQKTNHANAMKYSFDKKHKKVLSLESENTELRDALRTAIEALNRAKFDFDMAIESKTGLNVLAGKHIGEALEKLGKWK